MIHIPNNVQQQQLTTNPKKLNRYFYRTALDDGNSKDIDEMGNVVDGRLADMAYVRVANLPPLQLATAFGDVALATVVAINALQSIYIRMENSACAMKEIDSKMNKIYNNYATRPQNVMDPYREIFEIVDTDLKSYGPLAVCIQLNGLYHTKLTSACFSSILMNRKFGILFKKTTDNQDKFFVDMFYDDGRKQIDMYGVFTNRISVPSSLTTTALPPNERTMSHIDQKHKKKPATNDVFKKTIANPNVPNECNIPIETGRNLLEDIRKILTPQAVKIHADIEPKVVTDLDEAEIKRKMQLKSGDDEEMDAVDDEGLVAPKGLDQQLGDEVVSRETKDELATDIPAQPDAANDNES